MKTHIQRVGEHLELEIARHPERSYLTTLMNSRPQFSVDALKAEIESETEHWVKLLANLTNGMSFLEKLEGIRHIFDALKHENDALKDIAKGIAAQSKSEWTDAANFYCKAFSDLHFAHFDWVHAISEIADDSPLDYYYPSKDVRQKEDIEDPPRSSYKDLREIVPNLLRIYSNIDRVLCIGQELVQRQITCTSTYMQEVEAQREGE